MDSLSSTAARQRSWFLLFVLVLLAAFHATVASLLDIIQTDELYSHMVLVPFISLYLYRTERRPAPAAGPCGWALGVALAAAAVLAWTASLGVAPGVDRVSLRVFSLVTSLLAGVALFFGAGRFVRFLFPMMFLYFLVPLPQAAEQELTFFFQHWSGLATDVLLRWSGTPVWREGMVLQLPGLSIEVAEECSGIRASFVLFMTSLLASHMFLTRPLSKAILVASIVPIGIVRNAVRITVICLLTLHVDPGVIHGPLHREGGTPFFVLSLIPLFMILWLLRRWERRGPLSGTDVSGSKPGRTDL